MTKETMHALRDLSEAIDVARVKHPEGVQGIRSITEEAGEVARAMRREGPARVREEALDLAVVAIRLYLGEVDPEWT